MRSICAWLIMGSQPIGVVASTVKGVSAQVTAANAADDTLCTYILSGIKHASAGQSADVVA